jgi:RHS repeat-associated protein
VTTGTPPTARFPGQWFQSETGLHQNWMRDYDPTTGRYMQADPLGLVDGASVYGYARQSPGRYVDPRGTDIQGAVADFSTGFGSFFRGLYRCGSGYCFTRNLNKVELFRDLLQDNPEISRCLRSLLYNYVASHPWRVVGRVAGGQLSGAPTLLATRGWGLLTRATASGSTGAALQSFAAIGDFGYYLSQNPSDIAGAAMLFRYGTPEFELSDVPCECRGELGLNE